MKRRAVPRAPNRFGIGRGLDWVGWSAVGIGALAIASLGVGLGWERWSRWRLNRRVSEGYVEAACAVVESRVGTEARQHSHGASGRSTHFVPVYKPEIRYRYEVGNRVFVSARFSPRDVSHETAEPVRAIVERYAVGAACTCWYDPARPGDSFLEK